MIISSKILKYIIKIIENNYINYTKLSNIDKNKLNNDLISINDKYNINLSLMQILMMRDTYICLLAKTKGVIAHRLGEYIITDYNNNIPISDISKKYNLPSMTIIYQILIENKNESHKIDKIIKNNLLPKPIQDQMTQISKLDPILWYDYNIPSIDNELKKIKCSYKSYHNISNKFPNILFEKICFYKGKVFKWIVYKSYVLFNSNLHIHDINKIIKKFQKFGPGLILYNDIICSESFIKKININIDTYEIFN